MNNFVCKRGGGGGPSPRVALRLYFNYQKTVQIKTNSPLAQIQTQTRIHSCTQAHSFVEKIPVPFLYLQVEGFENPKAAVPDPGNNVSTPEVDGSLPSHVKPTAAKCSCEVCAYTLCFDNCYPLFSKKFQIYFSFLCYYFVWQFFNRHV